MNFALITEGVSEHRILKHILKKYFREEDPEINQIQPEVVNNKQETFGGWVEVLKYCEREELNDILLENNYLIIQIDTDKCFTKPFDVPHCHPDNSAKSINELHKDVVEKLQSLIKPEILTKYKDNIFFAICLHSIECWLLPVYYTNHHKASTGNCVATLNFELRKNKMYLAEKQKNSPNSIKTYEAILRNWKNKKDITNSAQYNFGFSSFIESLSHIPNV